jgi:hypothetical protein
MTKRLLLAALCLASFAAGQASTKTWAALTGAGTTTAFTVAGNDKHTVALAVTGTPDACTARLEGTVDGTTFFDVSGTQTCTSSVMFHVTDRPLEQVRVVLISLTGGTAPTVTPTYLGINSGGHR